MSWLKAYIIVSQAVTDTLSLHVPIPVGTSTRLLYFIEMILFFYSSVWYDRNDNSSNYTFLFCNAAAIECATAAAVTFSAAMTAIAAASNVPPR